MSLIDETFSANSTFNSGQIFRWRPVSESANDWIGVVDGSVLRVNDGFVRCLGHTKAAGDFAELVSRYFSFEDKIQAVLFSFPKNDAFLQSCVSEFSGLRLLTQDPWE